MNNNGTVDKSTTYTWAGTQQATKSVSVNSVPSVVQSFAYNVTGSMSSVTTTNYTSGTIASQSRVDYDYSSSGIRVKATDYTADLQTSNFTLQTSTEYLIDETNFTGYAQSIAETTRNASGQTTKRVVYTFGTDEITQTTYDYSSVGLPPTVSILHFGHDAHTSVRVLFDAITAIAQAYTYAAYGELLAIHNGLAQQILASGTNGLESAALTRMLYNGESFDSRIGQLYLRARWYNGHRFTTLDPFFGNASDPLSFHKYGFTHGNPVMNTDPTGLFSFGNVMAGIAIAGLAVVVGPNMFSSILSSTERSQSSGVGGRKIDGAIEGIVGDLKKQWARLDTVKKQLLFDAAHTSSGWEIREFKDEQYESKINPDAGLARTVSYDGEVYFKVEVNYFLFGAINYLATRNGISNFNLITGYNNGSISNMRTVITKYRGLSGIAYVGRRNDGSILGRELWAMAGWMYARDGQFEAPTRMRLPFARADNFPLEGSLNAYIGTPDGSRVAFSIDMRGRPKQLGE